MTNRLKLLARFDRMLCISFGKPIDSSCFETLPQTFNANFALHKTLPVHIYGTTRRMQSQLPVEFNGYLIFILALIVVSYALDTIADSLNSAQMSPELPEEFRGIYDAEKYGTAIRYQKDSFRF